MGLIYFNQQKNKEKEEIAKQVNKIFQYFAYQLVDLKYVLIELDSVCRGIGGIKKIFDINNLPSIKNKNKIQTQINIEQTEEQRLQRHKRFFEEMKKSFSNKQ